MEETQNEGQNPHVNRSQPICHHMGWGKGGESRVKARVPRDLQDDIRAL